MSSPSSSRPTHSSKVVHFSPSLEMSTSRDGDQDRRVVRLRAIGEVPEGGIDLEHPGLEVARGFGTRQRALVVLESARGKLRSVVGQVAVYEVQRDVLRPDALVDQLG